MQKMLLWWRPEFSHTLIAIQFTPAGIDGDESHSHVFLICCLLEPMERSFGVAQSGISQSEIVGGQMARFGCLLEEFHRLLCLIYAPLSGQCEGLQGKRF